MGFKSFIFKEDGSAKTASKSSNVQPAVSSISRATSIIQNNADDKIVDSLEEMMMQNSSGQDYFKFKQAIENMANIVMDEKVKFQTVFSVLSLQGCKKDLLLASIDKFIDLVQKEKRNFDSELKNQLLLKVQNKLDEIERTKKEVDNLTKQLSELNSKINSLSQDAQAEESKIKSTEEKFKNSAESVISQMNSDKQKIITYI
jgi:uncharacterized protein YoxC